MYGTLFYMEKLKPLVESAYGAAVREYDRQVQEGSVEEGVTRPEWFPIWTAVVKDEYAKESDEMKRKVAEAVEAQVNGGMSMSNGTPLQREGKLEEYMFLCFGTSKRPLNISNHRDIDLLPQMLQKIVHAVKRETGFLIVMLWGGPSIQEGGCVRTWQYVQF